MAPSQEQDLGRRPRTPASISYRPAPLQFPLADVGIRFGDRDVTARAEASVFDFGGVNVRLEIPLDCGPEELRRAAGNPALQQSMIRAARQAVEPLHQRLLPTIKGPAWSELVEEYFVFRFAPENWSSVENVASSRADWLAGLLRLEAGPLAAEQVNEALSRRIAYAPHDLVVIDWAAAVVIDHDCARRCERWSSPICSCWSFA
ncbi:MAG: hypothetical protein QM775_00440 [Pirellulales bacterium]